MTTADKRDPASDDIPQAPVKYYRIQFRPEGQLATALGTEDDLSRGDIVMVATDHGLEPATVIGLSPLCGCVAEERTANYQIDRLPKPGELDKFHGLHESETRAFAICNELIEKHSLNMNLVRVEKYFNGSKMIFYFTAENRVDFRGLVKDLVQEFRTRVEMRQVGVRHETKMIGGVGTCGRELCCSSFINTFDSVSIKMAKEQDLPLNPSKISGLCNRLLCCLTYEYETYRHKRKNMPKTGRQIKVASGQYYVKRQIPLKEMLVVEDETGEERILAKDEWQPYTLVKKENQERKKDKR